MIADILFQIPLWLSKIWERIYHRPRRELRGKKLWGERLFEIQPPEITESQPVIWLIKVDDIGDYILFRNTIAPLAEVAKRNGCSFKLLGNALWRPLFEQWDKKHFSECFWLDKGKFLNDAAYRKEVYTHVSAEKVYAVWVPNYSRSMWLEDLLARAIPAHKKVAWLNRFPGVEKWDIPHLDAPYNGGVDSSNTPAWEYHRYLKFASHLGAECASLPDKPQIPSMSGNLPKGLEAGKYAILFPGASAYRKRWSMKGFAESGIFLATQHNLPLVIAGGPGDVAAAAHLADRLKNEKPLNLAGKTDLPNLALLLANAKIVVSNDTGAAHISLAAGIPTIVVANGNAFGRYFPYPNNSRHRTIYSSLFEKIIKPRLLRRGEKDWKGMTVIQSIGSTQVNEAINAVL